MKIVFLLYACHLIIVRLSSLKRIFSGLSSFSRPFLDSSPSSSSSPSILVNESKRENLSNQDNGKSETVIETELEADLETGEPFEMVELGDISNHGQSLPDGQRVEPSIEAIVPSKEDKDEQSKKEESFVLQSSIIEPVIVKERIIVEMEREREPQISEPIQIEEMRIDTEKSVNYQSISSDSPPTSVLMTDDLSIPKNSFRDSSSLSINSLKPKKRQICCFPCC